VENDKQRLTSRTCTSSAALRWSAVLAIINTSPKIKNKVKKSIECCQAFFVFVAGKA
jgi:hypothetical protein